MQYKESFDLSQTLHGKGNDKSFIEMFMRNLAKHIDAFDPSQIDFTKYQEILADLEELGSLVLCMSSTNVKDSDAKKWEAQVDELTSKMQQKNLFLENALAGLSETEFAHLVEKYSSIAFHLHEKRRWILEKMPLEKEVLVEDLSPAGFKAWTNMYYSLIGEIPFHLDKETYNLSSLEPKLRDRNPEIRKKAYAAFNDKIQEHENLFALILNSLVSFRMKLFKNRRWNNIFHESLQATRITEKTLRTMMESIDRNKSSLIPYLQKKKQKMGLDTFTYFDVDSPLATDSPTIPLENGISLILTAFEAFSPKLKNFAEEALKKGWADLKKRPYKRAGGFCTSLPLSKKSLILLTYGDNFSSLSTLAHELGHAFHSHLLYDKPLLAQHYPMNVAESASTFCEILLTEYLRQHPSQLPIELIEDEICSRHSSFLLDLPARFHFDSEIHQKIPEGYLSAGDFSKLMEEVHLNAYQGVIEPFSHFWCYKMHFYFTDISFYNWPYSFGYLLSRGLYQLLKDDPEREEKFCRFFADSGSMNIHDLCQHHLHIDIEKHDFWNQSCEIKL